MKTSWTHSMFHSSGAVPGASANVASVSERAILTVTCLAAFLFFNSFGSIGVALPAIQRQFGNSLAEIQWVVLTGVVTISSLSFCFGRAGGIFGQRRFYKIGVALYAGGAGLGALAESLSFLLLARGVMAIGLALALPMSTALLASSFGAERRGWALGIFASAIAVGRMTGPTVGGLLMHWGDWTWIFWMNFFVGIAVTAAVAALFRGAGSQRKEPFDVLGSIALVIGYPALLMALTFGAKEGWLSLWVWAWLVLGAGGLSSFIYFERHAPRPIIDLAMFKSRGLTTAMIAVVLSHVIYHPITLASPLYLQNVLGASAVVTGFILAILPLSTALASPLSGRMADRLDASTIAGVGLLMIVGGIACYAWLGLDTSLLLVAAVLALLGAGIGVFTPANQKTAFASVAQEDYGVLAAMLSSFGTAAGTIGTTVVVALMELHVGGNRLWAAKEVFAGAQQFAFACLVPLGLLGLIIVVRSRAPKTLESSAGAG